jgi:hypothetical protein
MKSYYLKNKEKIKKQSMEWREKNPGKLKVIQSRYRTKHGVVIRDYREEKVEVLSFKERVSQETLLKMKENSRSNQESGHCIKYYEWQESWIPKKRVLEGV